MIKQPIIPLGIAAGLLAAIMLAAVQAGNLALMPLFALAPLPLVLVGLAYSPIGSAIGAASMAIAWSVIDGPQSGLVVFLLFAAPSAWIVYFFGLSRTAESGEKQWFPIERVLLHATAIAAITIVAVGLIVGFDPVLLAAQGVEAMQANSARGDLGLTADQILSVTEFYVVALPYFAAAGTLAVLLINAWLGSRLLEAGGRLKRGRQPAWATKLPPSAGYVLLAAIAGTLLPGNLGDAAAVVVGAFGLAYALVGLAVLHALTIGRDGRSLLLFMAYASTLFLGVSLILLAGLGLVDSFFRLRPQAPPLST